MDLSREAVLGPSARNSDHPSRENILKAAIRLMAQRGIQSTTIRDISQESDTNVASVNYHFGSKEYLVREVMFTVVTPVYSRRIELLKHAIESSSPQAPGLHSVLDALIRPLVEAGRDSDGGRTIIRLLSHARSTPDDPINPWLAEQFDNSVHHRFIDALVSAVPTMDRSEIIWRYELVRGATMHVLNDLDPRSKRLLTMTRSDAPIDDNAAVLERIIDFSINGFVH